MFCVNCGKELIEGEAFCTNCGWPTGQTEGDTMEMAPQPLKKRGKWGKSLKIFIPAAALALVIGVIFSFGIGNFSVPGTNFIRRNFSSPEKYFQ